MTTLATNLVGDWLLNGLKVVNSVDAHTETAFGSPGPTLQHNIGSMVGVHTTNAAMGFTGESTDPFYVTGTPGTTYSGFAAIEIESAVTQTAAGPILSTRDAGLGGVWGLYLTTARKIQLVWADNGGSTVVNLTSTTILSQDVLHTVGFTLDPTTGAAHIFIDGSDDANNGTPGSFNGTNGGQALLLCGENSSARSFPGTIFRLSLWKSRLLATADFASLNTSPLQIYAGFANLVQSNLAAFPVIQQGATGSITGATNATPIVITSTAHGLTTGTVVTIASVGGNTAANGTWTITVLTANTFSLNNSTGNASYTSGGTWTVQGVSVTLGQSVVAGHTLVAIVGTYAYPIWSNVTGATNASPIEITTGIAHNLSTGNTVQISGVQGNTAANGLWPVHVTSSTTFTLDGSTGNGTYTNATGYWSPHPVTDNIGNGNWNVLGPPSINGQDILSVHFVYSSASGVPTVTIEPLQGSSGFITIFLCELSGINVSTPDSFVAANGNIQSTNSPGTITVTTTRDLVIAAFCQGLNNIDAATVDSSFTMLGLQPGGIAFECLGVAAKISGSNETPTFSTFSGGSPQTIDWSGVGISLKALQGGLFLHPLLNGITTGGPYYRNPIG